MTEPELLQGGTAHHSRHERDVVSEWSRGGYPHDPDAILRYPGNVLLGLSDNRVRINESESEEGVEVNESVSARTRASKTKTDSHTAKGEQSRQPSRRFQASTMPSTPRALRTRQHDMFHAHARQIRTGKRLSAMRTNTVRLLVIYLCG